MAAKIFISYRRDDTKYPARDIHKALCKATSNDDVFMDVDSIPLGANYRKILKSWVGECDILLALIGPGWIEARDPKTKQRRVDNPNDFVRTEISEALARGIPVVPVLLDGTSMPNVNLLPDDLKELVDRQAEYVEYRTFDADLERLIRKLRLSQNIGHADLHQQPTAPVVVPSDDREGRRKRSQNVGRTDLHPQPTAPATARSDSREGRIRVDAKIVQGAPEGWFMPGNGKVEWFKDHENGPEMVVVPAGSFMMGSPKTEPGWLKIESPQHAVTVARPFAIGRHPVTRGQFAAFVKQTGYETEGGAWVFAGGTSKEDPQASWRNLGFLQDENHPVVCVSWNDAKAFAAWLSTESGQLYRLPSEAEWEYAARAGTTTPFWWGSTITPAQANYNGNYVYLKKSIGEFRGKTGPEFRGGTVAVGEFEANPWGLYQVLGNVLEWCEDIWNEDFDGAPSDGSPLLQGGFDDRVLRGGYWAADPKALRSAFRGFFTRPDSRFDIQGFRLGRTL